MDVPKFVILFHQAAVEISVMVLEFQNRFAFMSIWLNLHTLIFGKVYLFQSISISSSKNILILVGLMIMGSNVVK